MSKIFVLFNPLAGNGTCEKASAAIEQLFPQEDVEYVKDEGLDHEEFFGNLAPTDKVVLCGGDGTINYFANSMDTEKIQNELYYYPAGSGNDFYNDIRTCKEKKLVPVNEYFKGLPRVYVNGMTKKFVNGIGFGIDGYCCEEGDRQRQKHPGKRVNYTFVALKGLIYAYSRVNAKITLDEDKVVEYKDVWMVPSMNGRFYGGGMMCAPNQNRLESAQVSVIVVHSGSRIRLLLAFLSIFNGGHLKYKNIVSEYKAKKVHVEFDRATALQIDGETVKNVTEYTVEV